MEAELDDLWQRTWRELSRGVPDQTHGFHWPVVSTVDEHGAPHARVCVLRSANLEAGRLTFHTNRHAPKVRDIAHRPHIAMTFHDGRRKLQLRAHGRAQVHLDGELFDAGWSRIGPGSKRTYLAPHQPSTPSAERSANVPDHLIGQLPSAAEVAAGRDQFAVVAIDVTELDLLELLREGHRRARFTVENGELREATWLHP